MSDASAAEALRVIVGPTAAGKSALALALAQQFNGTIISADSRQIYKGFDIGTGKPAREERARVPHEGIDVAEPTDRWSAATFAAAANEWIARASNANRTPVIVGGTGFWIKALTQPLAPIPALDPVKRERLSHYLDTLPKDRLHAFCRALDPRIAQLGPTQWRRAIEVALLTGRRLSHWHADQNKPSPSIFPPPHSPHPRFSPSLLAPRYLFLDPGPLLADNIATRIDHMLATGWPDEANSLSLHVPRNAIAWKACGYERLRDAMHAGEPIATIRDEIVAETRRYARRQRTWFRTQLKDGPVTKLDPLAPDTLARATRWWNGADDE